MKIMPPRPSVKGPAEWFTGDIHFDVIAPGTDSRGKVNAVHFTPGARTAWHRHINGQTLHVIDDVCLTRSRGEQIMTIRPGDTVWCSPGQRHWHGATPDRVMTHLAIWDGLADGQQGPETECGAHVTDEEYGAGPSHLRARLEWLTDLQREAVTMEYYKGKTYTEVDIALKSPTETIKTRLRDGLIRLRDCLGVVA